MKNKVPNLRNNEKRHNEAPLVAVLRSGDDEYLSDRHDGAAQLTLRC